MLAQLTGRDRLALLLTGPGTHSAREVAHALGVPVAAVLPDDAARPRCYPTAPAQRHLTGAPARSARSAGQALRDHVAVDDSAADRGRCRAMTLNWPPAPPEQRDMHPQQCTRGSDRQPGPADAAPERTRRHRP